MFAKRFKTSLLPLFAGFLLLFHLVLAGPAAASAETANKSNEPDSTVDQKRNHSSCLELVVQYVKT